MDIDPLVCPKSGPLAICVLIIAAHVLSFRKSVVGLLSSSCPFVLIFVTA
jgi:hypothetical protein